jgi:translation initiation factor 1
MSSKKSGFSTLAELLRAQGFEASEEGLEEASHNEAALDPGLDLSAKLSVRRERKGRGGKTVTVVSGISGSSAALAELLRDWKKRLGRGARLEDGQVVVQGDCVEKLREFLAARGAKRVSVSP